MNWFLKNLRLAVVDARREGWYMLAGSLLAVAIEKAALWLGARFGGG